MYGALAMYFIAKKFQFKQQKMLKMIKLKVWQSFLKNDLILHFFLSLNFLILRSVSTNIVRLVQG